MEQKTIRNVAKAAGVSATTVSRVFSGKGYVSEEMRRRVLAVAGEWEYRPKAYKKQVRPVFCSAVGVVIPDICNRYYMEVIHGMEGVLGPQGVEVLICNTDEDPRKEARCLSALQKAGVGGIIAVPVSDTEQYNAQRLVELSESGMPVVLLDRDVRGGSLDGVFMDNFNSAYQSVREFIKNGHRHIALIAGPLTSTSGLARLEGYTAALKEHGIPLRGEYIFHGDFKFDQAYGLTAELLKKRLPVTGIFASNSRMAAGCLAALSEQGIKVPEDMAFISCGRLEDNLSRISFVCYPTQEIGEECARILLERMHLGKRAKAAKKRITFDMELVLRGSEAYPVNGFGRRGDGRNSLESGKL